MTKHILSALAVYYAFIAAILIVAPRAFYETVPGVAATGPFNDHFARDVGFAFLVSAAALFLGARRCDRILALFGAAFPVCHGLFHAVSWGHHSFPGNGVAILDLAANAGLAALTLFMASRLKGSVT